MQSGDVELDFQILDKTGNSIWHIVEVKMFKTDRPDDTTSSNLRDGFKKMLNARQKLLNINPGYANVFFHFLTNISDIPMLQNLANDFKNEIANARIQIQNANSMHQFITQLAATYQ